MRTAPTAPNPPSASVTSMENDSAAATATDVAASLATNLGAYHA